MARKKLIAGNWKMNGLLEDGVALAKGVAQEVKAFGKSDCEFLVCPPFTLLASVKKALRGAKVALGAQDVHFAEKGAHTGDISPLMLKDLGCSYVIVGHSDAVPTILKRTSWFAKKPLPLMLPASRLLFASVKPKRSATQAKPLSLWRFLFFRIFPGNSVIDMHRLSDLFTLVFSNIYHNPVFEHRLIVFDTAIKDRRPV